MAGAGARRGRLCDRSGRLDAIRAGLILDRQLFRSATGDAPLFSGYTVGTGIILGPVLLDVAYLRESGHFSTPSSATRTTHTTRRFFVSLIYRHPRLR